MVLNYSSISVSLQNLIFYQLILQSLWSMVYHIFKSSCVSLTKAISLSLSLFSSSQSTQMETVKFVDYKSPIE